METVLRRECGKLLTRELRNFEGKYLPSEAKLVCDRSYAPGPGTLLEEYLKRSDFLGLNVVAQLFLNLDRK
jgi:hypothetical protein